jgi:hypothetical protein
MPYTDHARCLSTAVSNGEGRPIMIHFEFIDKTLSALKRPARSVFFSLRKEITWQQAEELVVQLNKTVATMDITEYAFGEYERNIF